MDPRQTPRVQAILALCPREPLPIVDVGADHGYVAEQLGAIAVETEAYRCRNPRVRWVVADGLSAFETVGVAVITGMGARTIAGILDRGPRPAVAVVHAPDDPPLLRRLLKAQGWRIEAELLAPEARRYAEILRVVPGDEPSEGFVLDYGPCLLREGGPLVREHLGMLVDRFTRIAFAARGHDDAKAQDQLDRARFLADRLGELGPGADGT
jgi:tRNA A22 N-methylase